MLTSCKTLNRISGEAPEPTVVDVVNKSNSDVDLFVVNGARAIRLGRVIRASGAKFTLTHNMLPGGFGSLQLIASPLDGQDYLLPLVTVMPGDIVSVRLDVAQAQAQVTTGRPQ